MGVGEHLVGHQNSELPTVVCARPDRLKNVYSPVM